jgi:hypothetical protein
MFVDTAKGRVHAAIALGVVADGCGSKSSQPCALAHVMARRVLVSEMLKTASVAAVCGLKFIVLALNRVELVTVLLSLK